MCQILISVLKAGHGDKGEEKAGLSKLQEGRVEGWG